MKYLITENQNKIHRANILIKDIIDSYHDNVMLKVDYALKYNDEYDYYTIYPTFHIKKEDLNQFATGLSSHRLAQKIQDYTGLNINASNAEVITE
jgi:hypothetical protein